MKLTSTVAATLLVFANAASAGQCVAGLNYCGSTLVDGGETPRNSPLVSRVSKLMYDRIP